MPDRSKKEIVSHRNVHMETLMVVCWISLIGTPGCGWFRKIFQGHIFLGYLTWSECMYGLECGVYCAFKALYLWAESNCGPCGPRRSVHVPRILSFELEHLSRVTNFFASPGTNVERMVEHEFSVLSTL